MFLTSKPQHSVIFINWCSVEYRRTQNSCSDLQAAAKLFSVKRLGVLIRCDINPFDSLIKPYCLLPLVICIMIRDYKFSIQLRKINF